MAGHLTVLEGAASASFSEHPTEVARKALLAAAACETDDWAAVLRRVASALPHRAPLAIDREGGA
jgi:hypothetical protein